MRITASLIKTLLIALTFGALPLAAHATDYITVEHPRQECWTEQVAARSSDYSGAIIGGIAGGILGNQVGGGSGKTIATGVGAATGAVIGDRMSSPTVATQTVQRCRTVVHHERVPVAKRVYRVEHDEHRYYKQHHRHYKKHYKKHDDDDDDDD